MSKAPKEMGRYLCHRDATDDHTCCIGLNSTSGTLAYWSRTDHAGMPRMTQPTLPPAGAGTVSMFSLTDSLGINANAWPTVLNSLESRPDVALLAIGELRDALDVLEANAVARLRPKNSWAKIAGYLGVTRQAAQKRHPDIA